MNPRVRLVVASLLFAAMLGGGLWLRGYDLAAKPTSGDESESAINALTILQHGVPIDRYLGLPMYENTLTEPWPDHPEYEFRDSSYSQRGLAIYHGWLPLYSMAGSLAAFGVKPDDVTDELRVRHTPDQIRRRIIAARVPSVIFGGIFLVLLFFAARDMGGRAAGWAALGAGAIASPLVVMAREARYHSLTLVLSTGCCWAIWRAKRHQRWRDFILIGVALALLFHTHLVSFAVACLMLACLIPDLVRRPRIFWKCVAAGAIVIVAAAPWVWATGFLLQAPHIPPARAFLSFPEDFIQYPLAVLPAAKVPLLLAVWMLLVLALRKFLPRPIVWPMLRRRQPLLFLLSWIVVGFLAFTLMVPAASYFYKRMSLAVIGPGVIWAAILSSVLLRSLRPRPSAALAPLALVGVICATGMNYRGRQHWTDAAPFTVIERLRTMRLARGTKVYCTPNDQFTLTYLSGLPVQSSAPVRCRFFDSYAGPMLIIESQMPYKPIHWREIAQVAERTGRPVSDQTAQALHPTLSTRLVRERLLGRVASIEPPLEDLSSLGAQVRGYQLAKHRRWLDKWVQRGAGTPLLRDFELNDWSEWWPLFFYRFVDPRSRMGPNMNYACRVREAHAEVLPTSWVIYHCPPRQDPHTTSLSRIDR